MVIGQLPTANCQLPTANCQLSTVNCQLSTVNRDNVLGEKAGAESTNVACRVFLPVGAKCDRTR
ncbi:MAG: hypothetical protein JGK24_27050 [Microcoleus sp. PH2017_29_MFU_D_A]|uniref:hypothetical protein n=1 Tax=unclassified Microcoleus TaxID=2642155 RepID=UPI001D6DEB00|nr:MULTISPECIES: hypothetical protein [unclassified Microcoleus]MCC3439135.1 hypothetical protein [Microcoleus sp. PH2017_05_CCC_O_A]MCC3453249.1 hypothetical protein [Microcoleus sp. PH2017_08_TRC_O_A]MCC3494014.1 hypothetical protein [Microcoleus sp. PH2017_16_JOR_D_A]MCC3496176.1 hypothetical protein [Microcoleus sp. PH2017_15_JOR_U_A]MCC3533442.1 hypothetical protein [Microcoleus sp. PH2017_25_DOB_D_A]